MIKMSPFVKIIIGDFTWESTVSICTGGEPIWGENEAFQYNVVDACVQMIVELHDH